jgi:hypothetical protein
MNLSILFPMAGDGQRFGGTFKPFLDATEKKFIELAKEPFSLFTNDPRFRITFVFIYRRDQEEDFNVSERLTRMFPDDTIQYCILDQPTSGPFETVTKAIQQLQLSGSCMICDCDHSIQLTEVLDLILDPMSDMIVPTWTFKEDDYFSWAKVKLNGDRHAISFHEKERVEADPDGYVEGLIGCYFIRNINDLNDNNVSVLFSEFFSLNKHKVSFMRVSHAEFFGTPEQLISFRFDRAKKFTFFVDIDGTLLYLPKHVPYEASDTIVLPQTIEQLTLWRKHGHTIVLTTGRVHERRPALIKQLNDLGIPYDQLVTGLASGTRIVINDKKPYHPFHCMATGIQLRRNEGISRIHLEAFQTPDLIRKLKGGSFADVYLVYDGVTTFVRKSIDKRPEHKVHVDTLRRQYEDLKRFNYYSAHLCPDVLDVHESADEYWFDMEYKKGYVELSTCSRDTWNVVLPKVLDTLLTHVYCYSKPIDGRVWLDTFLQDKIVSKYKMIGSIDVCFYKAVHDPFVTINGIRYKGVRHFFESETLDPYFPSHVHPIHGDLTLENILWNEEQQAFSLIDPSGSRYVDVIEMEVAKLLQFTVARYSEWELLCDRNELASFDGNVFQLGIVSHVTEFDYIPNLLHVSMKKGLFYLATYFIRMIPFLLVHSKQKALAGLLYAITLINSSHSS